MLDNDAAFAAVSLGTEDVSVLSSAREMRTATVYAGDYLNKLSGESVERECCQLISRGAREIVVNFSRTEIVNSIGVSILLGVIDVARTSGTRVAFADVNDSTVELFELLGITNHVQLI